MNLKISVEEYSQANDSVITEYRELKCQCGSDTFKLYSEDGGGAYVICSRCELSRDIENSKRFIESEEQNICRCENELLEIAIGRTFYSDSDDAKWVYIGGRCNQCDLAGVYVNWLER